MNAPETVSHEQAVELIPWLVNESLVGKEKEAVLEHAQSCVICRRDLDDLDWFTCAFGSNEQACVMKGIKRGGHARVGFENNLQLPDGEIAQSSAALVSSLSHAILTNNRSVAGPRHTAQLLGIRSA